MAERWKPIPFFSDKYRVSSLGRIKNIKTGRILCPHPTNVGYLTIQLSRNGVAKSMYVHRLVAMAFLPNPNNLQEVNHKDFNRENNHLNNLEWCSREQNAKHAAKNGRRLKKNRSKIVRYVPSKIPDWRSISVQEHFDNMHWTAFLKSLPIGTTTWLIEKQRSLNSLRTTAPMLSKKSSRKYSIRQDKKDTSVYNITVEEVTL